MNNLMNRHENPIAIILENMFELAVSLITNTMIIVSRIISAKIRNNAKNSFTNVRLIHLNDSFIVMDSPLVCDCTILISIGNMMNKVIKKRVYIIDIISVGIFSIDSMVPSPE